MTSKPTTESASRKSVTERLFEKILVDESG